METQTEPRIYTTSKTLGTTGTVTIKFDGEQFKGQPILDTKVSINGSDLCWILWKDKDDFMNELQSVIEKYYI